MGRKYPNDPIIEAVCEFRFHPDSPWDLAIPGLVYEKVRETFSKRRGRRLVAVNVSTEQEDITQKVQAVDVMQFLRDDEKAFIQVGPNLLSINHLKPYPAWNNLLPLIETGFETYSEVAQPTGIHRVGLRYINRMEIEEKTIELEDYLEFRPFIGSRLPQDFGPFMTGVQFAYEGSRDMLRLQLTSAIPENIGSAAVILDLDYFLVKPGDVELDGVLQWVGSAHDRIEEVFEACITDRLRHVFEKEVAT